MKVREYSRKILFSALDDIIHEKKVDKMMKIYFDEFDPKLKHAIAMDVYKMLESIRRRYI